MDFEIGSLADLISGTKSPSSKKQKSFMEKNVVKFETLKRPREPKSEVKEMKKKKKVRFTEHEDSDPESLNDVTVQKKSKKKVKDSMDLSNDVHNEKEIKTERELTYSLCAARRLKMKRKKENILAEDDSKKEREIFVGNVPVSMKKTKLIKLFSQYGAVESVRLRCVPLSDTRISKKVTYFKKKFHPDRKSMNAFVRFMDVDSAKKAIAANGMIYDDHHLRVDLVLEQSERDSKKAVFLGNIPFGAEEEDLWKMFESCGSISSVRILRDRITSVGKGIAYINFESTDAVELALNFDGELMQNRPIRVSRVKKHKKGKQKTGISNQTSQKIKLQDSEFSSNKSKKKLESFESEHEEERTKNTKWKSKNKKVSAFQGQKVAENKGMKKKKKKVNKEESKKKSMIEKIASGCKPSKKKMKSSILKIRSATKKIKFKP